MDVSPVSRERKFTKQGEGAERDPWNRGNPMAEPGWERQAGSLQADCSGI